jgi:hypothetical protein
VCENFIFKNVPIKSGHSDYVLLCLEPCSSGTALKVLEIPGHSGELQRARQTNNNADIKHNDLGPREQCFKDIRVVKLSYNLVALSTHNSFFSCLVSLNHDILGARLLDGRRCSERGRVWLFRVYKKARIHRIGVIYPLATLL